MSGIDFSAFVQQLGFDPRLVQTGASLQNGELVSDQSQPANSHSVVASPVAKDDVSAAAGGSSDGLEAANMQLAVIGGSQGASSDGQQGALVPMRRPERPYVRALQAEVYVTRVKKHNEKPMAYVTFSSPEVAQLVHMTPPSAVGGIPVLPPRQHQSDPNSLVLKWQEGMDIPADVISQDFAAFAAAYTGQGIVTGVKKHAQKSMAFVTFFSPTLAQAVLANPPPTVSGTPVLPPRPHQTDANAIVLKWNDSVELASDAIAAEFDTFFTNKVGEPLLLKAAPGMASAAALPAPALPKPGMPMLPGQMPMMGGPVAGNANMSLAAAGIGLLAMPGMMTAGGGVAATPHLQQAGFLNTGMIAPQLKRTADGLPTASAAAGLTGAAAVASAGGALQAMWENKRQRLLEGNFNSNG